jgi:hypothetical protein
VITITSKLFIEKETQLDVFDFELVRDILIWNNLMPRYGL